MVALDRPGINRSGGGQKATSKVLVMIDGAALPIEVVGRVFNATPDARPAESRDFGELGPGEGDMI